MTKRCKIIPKVPKTAKHSTPEEDSLQIKTLFYTERNQIRSPDSVVMEETRRVEEGGGGRRRAEEGQRMKTGGSGATEPQREKKGRVIFLKRQLLCKQKKNGLLKLIK